MNIRRHARALGAVALLAVAACGSDDSSNEPEATTATTAAATTTTSPATTAATPTTGGASADPAAYCQAHLGVEAAFIGGDPAGIETAVGDAQEVIPAEIADALDAVVANAPTEPGPPDPAFAAAYADLVDWVRDNCGFEELSVLATDYAFGGLADELPAGPTIFDLTNDGAEFHEIALLRKADGVTESFDDLLALPEDQMGAKATFVGVAFAPPGETGASVVDLASGEYLAICFVPTGATPEVLAAGPPPDAEPHFAHGMRHEFTVA
jgi:hypothetical protein